MGDGVGKRAYDSDDGDDSEYNGGNGGEGASNIEKEHLVTEVMVRR